MYVDADWAGCEKTRRSTTGYLATLYGSPINWCSKRQATTAASTMEAEYIAASEATKDTIWLRNLLGELGLIQDRPTTVYVDNQAAIRLAGNPSTHSRSKHIDIRHHIIRERVEMRDIDISYIETAKQRADVLTKPLGGPQHALALKAVRLEKLENRDKNWETGRDRNYGGRDERDLDDELEGQNDGEVVKGSVKGRPI